MNPLKEARYKKGWNARELGRQSGVHYVTISELETGKRKASIDTLHKLANALEIPWQSLAELSEDEEIRNGPKTDALAAVA